jgi:prepilin-type N-terminal cleavage/methylation domain-containing protein
MTRDSNGFTLLEIAIVLVIIGLLLSGVLKGQELITSARVRNLISQQDGVKTAFFGFEDRYRAVPGDYSQAGVNINCGATVCLQGNGNGRIEAGTGGAIHEEILAWQHLTAAGFLLGSYTMANSGVSVPDESNNARNFYTGVYLELVFDNNWGPVGNAVSKHHLNTGGLLPVEILAEVDRKIDDGRPYSGAFQFTAYALAGDVPPDPATCVTGAEWNIGGGDGNCGGASLF